MPTTYIPLTLRRLKAAGIRKLRNSLPWPNVEMHVFFVMPPSRAVFFSVPQKVEGDLAGVVVQQHYAGYELTTHPGGTPLGA